MIGKRIRKRARRKRRPLAHVRAVVEALTAYSIDADLERLLELGVGRSPQAKYVLDMTEVEELGAEAGEKVDAHGTRNLVGEKLVDHQQQMIAACLLAPGVKDPIEHYVISWRAGEIPTSEHIEEVVDIFAAEMGFRSCQILWATHSNTAQRHLHLVVNRVDLVSGRPVAPGEGWDIDRLHQVLALIEDRQGWSAEPNAIYRATDGEVLERATGQVVRRADGSRDGCYKRSRVPPERGIGHEFEAIAAALRSAVSWRDLHYRLAGEHAAYVQKGSGAELVIEAKRMRASDFGREFSYKNMVERLGPYEPDVSQSRDPHELYQLALRNERVRVREALNAALAHAREKRRLALRRVRQLKRGEYLQAIDAARVELAFDHVEAAIKREFDAVRRLIAASYLNRERWYQAGQPIPEPLILPEVIFAGEAVHDVAIAEEHGFRAQRHEAGADYHDRAGARAVSDLGVLLLVHQRNLAAVELALELASTRGNSITVSGSEGFLDLCREVAKRRGYNVVAEDGISLAPSEPASEPSQQACPMQPRQAKRARQEPEPDAAVGSSARRRARPEPATPPTPTTNQQSDSDRLVELAFALRAQRDRGD